MSVTQRGWLAGMIIVPIAAAQTIILHRIIIIFMMIIIIVVNLLYLYTVVHYNIMYAEQLLVISLCGVPSARLPAAAVTSAAGKYICFTWTLYVKFFCTVFAAMITRREEKRRHSKEQSRVCGHVLLLLLFFFFDTRTETFITSALEPAHTTLYLYLVNIQYYIRHIHSHKHTHIHTHNNTI